MQYWLEATLVVAAIVALVAACIVEAIVSSLWERANQEWSPVVIDRKADALRKRLVVLSLGLNCVAAACMWVVLFATFFHGATWTWSIIWPIVGAIVFTFGPIILGIRTGSAYAHPRY